MCVSLLLSDVDRRLNREIGGDGVLSHTTHLGLHDNSCFETLLWEEGKLERLSRPRVVGWLPASEQWCGRGAAGGIEEQLGEQSQCYVGWGNSVLLEQVFCFCNLVFYTIGEQSRSYVRWGSYILLDQEFFFCDLVFHIMGEQYRSYVGRSNSVLLDQVFCFWDLVYSFML